MLSWGPDLVNKLISISISISITSLIYGYVIYILIM